MRRHLHLYVLFIKHNSLARMAPDMFDSNVSSLTTAVPQDVGDTVKPYYLYWQFDVYMAVFLYVPPFLLVLGTLGNGLTIVVLLSREMRASGVNIILTVLAMADLCLLYTGLLRNWVLFVSRGGLDLRAINIYTCRIHMFLTFLARELSSMTLALMTIERAISVCAPLRAREWCSRGNTIKALAGMVTILAGMNIINFISVTFDHRFATEGQKCFYNDQVVMAFYTLSTALISYIPCTIIFFGNGLIIYKLMSAARRRASKMATTEASSSTTNTSIMLVSISLFFLITNLPFSVWANGHKNHWPMRSPDQKIRVNSMMTYAITYQLSMINNCFNFLFYCCFGQAFRKAFATIILRRPPSSTMTTGISHRSTGGTSNTENA